jgi:hypothetical protein
MSVEDSLDGSSENELKPEMLENEEDWSRLSTVSSDSSYPTYTIGGVNQGLGLLQIEETPEMNHELIVVYEFVSAGEDEIYTNIAGKEPDIHTVDLPYNQFDDREKAEEYAGFVMDYGVENVLRDHGLKTAKNRTF